MHVYQYVLHKCVYEMHTDCYVYGNICAWIYLWFSLRECMYCVVAIVLVRNDEIKMFNQSEMLTGLWFIEQFKHICRQSVSWTHLNIGGWLRDCPGLTNFLSCSADFPPFPELWFVNPFPFTCKHSVDRIVVKLGRFTHYGICQDWLTFSHILPYMTPPSHFDSPNLWRQCIHWYLVSVSVTPPT